MNIAKPQARKFYKISDLKRRISRKSYEKFIFRISSLAHEYYTRVAMTEALDAYLDGKEVSYQNLPEDYLLAFKIMIFEVEKAIQVVSCSGNVNPLTLVVSVQNGAKRTFTSDSRKGDRGGSRWIHNRE